MRKGETIELYIKESEFGAQGIAYENDLKIYVKGAFEGQKISARVTKKKKDYAEAKLLEVLERADYEIEPQCPQVAFCGGCQSQNLSYDKQLEFKKKQVLKLFEEASIATGDFLGIEGSPSQFEYRNKMEFTFGDFEKGGELSLGMHRKGSPFSIITVDNCMLVDEDYRNLLKTTLDYFKEKDLPYYKIMKHEGYLRHFIIRKSKATSEIMVNLVTTTQIDFDLSEYCEKLKSLNLKGTLKSIIHTFNDSYSDAVIPEKVEILHGEDYITEELLGLKFKISPFSFFQTNSKGAEKLYSIVRDFMGESDNKTVFDLYCGTGTIGQIVAPKAQKVIGVELIEEAVEAANENAKLNGLNNCNFIAGDVAKVIQEIKDKPDIIILDPPRSGVHPKALEYVVKFNPKDIIYVSCNPKTLVQDLKYLIGNGYVVEKTRVMDMFPNTPHVETCVLLYNKEYYDKEAKGKVKAEVVTEV